MPAEKRRPTHMAEFHEDVLLMNQSKSLTSSELDAIELALSNNSAVGIIAGSYDEDLSISFASRYFLENLGYDYLKYAAESSSLHQSFLSLIREEDRPSFDPERFRAVSGDFSFRILMKDGTPLYAHAFKTESEDANGSPQWVLSVRVSWESIDFARAAEAERAKTRALEQNEALNELIQAMSRLIVRFAICDVTHDSYVFFDCGNGARYESSGTFHGLIATMFERLKTTDDRLSIDEIMNAEFLNAHLKKPSDVFRFDYAEKDESTYYNMSVVPLEWENGRLTRFVMLGQDITQTKRIELKAQQALSDACAAARHANEAKTEFLSNMSHDIRTPMNAIIGMTAIACAHIDQKDRVLDSLEKITHASRHLLSLINDLLDMSKIEKGTLTLSEDDFNLSELIDGMIDIVKPEIASHGHSFEMAIRNVEHELVIGDSLKIQQIFTNIISNAIKYTPDGGAIRLTLTEKPTHHPKIGCYEFVFEDNGIGMSPEFLKVIFDPFERARSRYVNDVQGTGLGMAITKNIVNMMNGDIKVESTLGVGSKFTVTIFLKLQEREDSEANELLNLPVLVVDDDTICCESTVETLSSIGMVGEWVDNGPEAIERTVRRHEAADDYFAIIMDWKMPEMDGIATAREIRRRIGNDIPIIMLSAFDYSEIETEAREAGIDCFIAKPLFKSRLKTVFRQLIRHDEPEQKTQDTLNEIRQSDYSEKRILIVEDNEINREIAMEIIGTTGAAIETAVNGQEAVDLVAKAPRGYYDLVFMDIQMPVMDGYQATAVIRELPDDKGKTLPIVAMTANAFAEDVIRAKNAGMNEHIAKPISINKLHEILKSGLR